MCTYVKSRSECFRGVLSGTINTKLKFASIGRLRICGLGGGQPRRKVPTFSHRDDLCKIGTQAMHQQGFKVALGSLGSRRSSRS